MGGEALQLHQLLQLTVHPRPAPQPQKGDKQIGHDTNRVTRAHYLMQGVAFIYQRRITHLTGADHLTDRRGKDFFSFLEAWKELLAL